MDITDNTLAYSGISVIVFLLIAVVVSIIKYSCNNTGENGQRLLEDHISEV